MLLKNTSLYFVGELVNRIGKLAAMYLVASAISKADFGGYSYLLSICLIVLVFLDLGMNTLVMLRTSWKRFEHLLPFFFAGKVVTISIVCIALTLFDLWRGFFGATGTLAPFLLLCVGWDASAFLGNSLRARLDFFGEFWIKVIANIGFLSLIGIAIIARLHFTMIMALWLQALAFLPACLLGLVRVSRGVRRTLPSMHHAKRGFLAIGKIGVPMSLAASVGVVQPSIDSIVLGASKHLEVNASFTLVNRLGQIAQLPINIFIFSSLPYIVDALRGGRKPDRETLQFLIISLAGIGAVAAQMFVLIVEWGLPAILGPKYSDTAYFAAWLGFYIVPLYIYPVLTNVMAVMRSIVAIQSILAAATIANIALDLFAITFFGPYAVAWVAGSMHWVLLLLFSILYRQKTGDWPITKLGASITFLGGAMVLLPSFVFSVKDLPETMTRVGIAIAALAATATYCFKFRDRVKKLLYR